ncbi:MAG TPA: hypothetical protein VFR59_10290, partial [Steroidobacteraceae bacterium]|nr:hypothetical protein [Steroidobacteraceae bacterium]
MAPVSFSDDPSDSSHASHLLLRAILAFVAMPGMVAYAVPVLILAFGSTTVGAWHPAGLALLTLGTLLLLWCVRDFY